MKRPRRHSSAKVRPNRKPFLELLEDRRLLTAVPGVNYSTGTQMRMYTLALATTAEFTENAGGPGPTATLLNRYVDELNKIFGPGMAIQFQLHPQNNKLIFTNKDTDGYTNGNDGAMLGENPPIVNMILNGNKDNQVGFDIGHVLGIGGSGGVAGGVTGQKAAGVTNPNDAEANPPSIYTMGLMAHEMAHQLGVDHSFNSTRTATCKDNRGAPAGFEPGSGSTIMGYVRHCGADNLPVLPGDNAYFNVNSYEEMIRFIAQDYPNGGVLTATGNSLPTVNAGVDRVIPALTPFTLLGIATDPDAGDKLTYQWEQIDNGGPIQESLLSIPLTVKGKPATEANTLNELDQTTAPYVAGDKIRLTGTDRVGAIQGTYTYKAGDTLANLLRGGDVGASIEQTIRDANGAPTTTATITPQGKILVQYRASGLQNSNLTLQSDPADAQPASGLTTFGTISKTATGQADTNGIILPISNAQDQVGPLFRTYFPTTDSARTFPRLADILANITNATSVNEHLPSQNRDLNFRLQVQDNHRFNGRTVSGVSSDDVKLTVVNTGKPFEITSHNGANQTLVGGSKQTVTWEVAGTTANGINTSKVDILLSIDGGLTYPIKLATGTDNDGTEEITLPNANAAKARIKLQADPAQNVFFDLSNADLKINQDLAAPGGVVITESGGTTKLAEGAAFNIGVSATDTYTIALTQPPQAEVEVTISVDAQTQVSLDGTNFAATQILKFAAGDGAAKTVTVRAVDDAVSEGVHTSVIRHAVTKSGDTNYNPAALNDQTINSVTATLSDDESSPLIGIDFNSNAQSPTPTNWTPKTDIFDLNSQNMLRENGDATNVDLTVTIAAGNGGGTGGVALVTDTVPRHGPVLNPIESFFLYQQTPSVTAVWSDLAPNKKYRVYVFAVGEARINQKVTITGGGADNPAPFNQVGAGNIDKMLVNATVGNKATDLESFGLAVTSDATGKITVLVESNVANGDVALSALAIQELLEPLPPPPGITVVETGGKTEVSEAGTTDTFTVKLDAAPASDVVLKVISGKTTEATVSPATLTFTPGNFNVAQTVTVTGVDDPIVDFDQTSVITISVDAANSAASYNAVAAKVVNALNQDNDVPGISIVETGGKTEVTEPATQDTFTVVLTAQPLTDVVFNVVSGRTTEATVDTTTLTFTPANYNIPQVVAVTAADDLKIDGDQNTEITVSVDAGKSDAKFGGVAMSTVKVVTKDNDVAAFTIVETDGKTEVSEAGSKDTFTVRLATQPETNVEIEISTGNDKEAVFDKTTLVFTKDNFNIPQTVTVTGVDDQVIDGDQTTDLKLTINKPFSDATYGNVADKVVKVTTIDNDAASFRIVQNGGTTEVSEAGTTNTFSVVLAAKPAGDVVLNVTSGNLAEVTAVTSSVTFTPANFDQPQEVTVKGVDDLVVDGDQTTNVTVSVDVAKSHASFAAAPSQVVKTMTKDDDQAGLTIVETDGKSEVSETRTTDTFSVRLNTQPVNPVVLLVTSGTLTEATVDKATLTFTSANFNVPQTVTITGVDDQVVDGDQVTDIKLAIDKANSDATYNAIANRLVKATTNDDDVPDMILTETGGKTEVTEVGTTDTFTVVLTRQPTSTVVLTVTSADTSEVQVDKPTLTFTPAEFNVPQTITVTGVPDQLLDGDRVIDVKVDVDRVKSNAAFAAIAEKIVKATNKDLASAGIRVTEDGGATVVSEAGTTSVFTVVLTARPASDVVLNVVSVNTAEAKVDKASLTFSPANFDQPQSVTVTGVDDKVVDGDQTTDITVSVHVAQSDARFAAVPSRIVKAVTKDDDQPGLTITKVGGKSDVTEAGGQATFLIKLNTDPVNPVVVRLTSGNNKEVIVDKAEITLTTTGHEHDKEKSVILIGVDDVLADGNQITDISVEIDVAKSDATYANVAKQVVKATTIDDDDANFTITETGGGTEVSENGTTDTFSVVLNAHPLANVVLNVASQQTGEATVDKATLTFTPANWDQPQIVTVTGIDDTVGDGDQLFQVKVGVDNAKSAPAFANANNGFVNVTNRDNDVVAVPVATFVTTTRTENEGNTAEIVSTIELNIPAPDVLFVQVVFEGTATFNDPENPPAVFDYTVQDIIVRAFTFSIPKGEKKVDIKLNLIDDTLPEVTEKIVMKIDPASAGITVGAKDRLTIDVTDNDKQWQNPVKQFDVSGDGNIVPLDVLRVINELNAPKFRDGIGKLPDQRPAGEAFFDVNGDGFVSTNDVLQIVNHINRTGNPEGEREETNISSPAIADFRAAWHLAWESLNNDANDEDLDFLAATRRHKPARGGAQRNPW